MLAIEKKIGFHFKNKAILEQALVHRSANKLNNERLEFLGDSILNFIIAQALYERFGEAVEGQLSRLRASLVREETLAKVAIGLEIGPHLVLGVGEMRSGGENRASILADALEAIIAAIYLDQGFAAARERVLSWFQQEIDSTSLDNLNKDAKSELQEFLQSRQLPLPRYELVGVRGKDHAQTFIVSCSVDLLSEPVIGENTSRRRAEQTAASNVLGKIKV